MQAMSIYILIVASWTVIGILTSRRIHTYLIVLDVLLLLVAVLSVSGGRTTLTSGGIRTHWFFVPMALRPWTEVVSVYEQQRSKVTKLKVRMNNGREYSLSCPVTTTWNPDPDFPAHRDQIVAYWHRHVPVSDSH